MNKKLHDFFALSEVFPRQCGGQPSLHLHDGDLLPFSPPVRGSTLKFKTFIRVHLVFPASAGVNLWNPAGRIYDHRFPRRCGGQP